MNTPAVTPVQIGASTIYAGVATGCLASGTTGLDLLTYLGSATLVTIGAFYADSKIRNGRADNAGMLRVVDQIEGAA